MAHGSGCSSLSRSIGFVLLLLMAMLLNASASAATYYVSFSGGNDANNGLSSATPWKTFNSVNALTLQPGDAVLLKRGDTWNQELHLQGRGTSAARITLSSYGTGNFPLIQRGASMTTDKCVVIEGAHYWTINTIDCKSAKLGLYLRYDNNFFNSSVDVSYCNFSNMSDTGVDPALNNYEFAWSCGIWLGGHAWAPNEYANVLDGFSVKNCTFNNCQQAIGSNYYWPAVFKSRLRNVVLEDCYANNCLTGIFALSFVDGGYARRCSSVNGGGYFIYGTTAGFLQYCKNFTVDNCEFGWTAQLNCPDGVGFDFEGANEDCAFTNNVCHNNDGAGILVMNSGGDNLRLNISNNTFYDNSRNPYAAHGDYEMLCYQATNTGTCPNNGLYRAGATAHFSPDWTGFTLSNNRQNLWSSVSTRPRQWEFNTNGNLLGWTGFNQWSSVAVNGGALRGTSSGADPYGHSSNTWANRWEYPYVKVRMSQTAGSFAQLFFITESDGAWNGAKSITFPITPDGTMRDYVVDLRGASTFQGVVTKARLDPTVSSGSTMAVDYVRFSGNP